MLRRSSPMHLLGSVVCYGRVTTSRDRPLQAGRLDARRDWSTKNDGGQNCVVAKNNLLS